MGGSGSLFGGADISGGLDQLGGYENDLTGLGSTLQGYGNQTLGTAENQYQTGASGQLTPGWQALSQNELTQANLGTTAQYGNLGLGSSTMKQQDLGANQLQNLAEQGNLAALEEQLGLQGLQTGSNMLTGAGSMYSGAAGIAQNSISDSLASAAQSKSGLSSGISGAAGLGGLLGGIF
jgi:hypothetical protein